MSALERMRARGRGLLVLGSLLVAAHMACAQLPGHVGRLDATEADRQAILQVTADFRDALSRSDAKRLSGLLLHTGILFSTPASPARVRALRAERNVHADGVGQAGAVDFLNFVATAKVPIEERFHNIRITQDGHLAWVMFDFEFLEAGKVENHGLEVWQMLKTADDRWKILSVVWSSHGAPR
jgi:hypothetical protein